jgi:hypothetical protein
MFENKYAHLGITDSQLLEQTPTLNYLFERRREPTEDWWESRTDEDKENIRPQISYDVESLHHDFR